MDIRKGLRFGLGGLLIASALFKLTAVSYVAGILFSLLPLGWVNSFLAGHLGIIVLFVSILELCMGLCLLTRHSPKVLPVAAGYLLLMILLNSYQWYKGVGDCGCLGGWIPLPPQLTMVKTLLLLGCALYLLLLQVINRQSRRLIHQS